MFLLSLPTLLSPLLGVRCTVFLFVLVSDSLDLIHSFTFLMGRFDVQKGVDGTGMGTPDISLVGYALCLFLGSWHRGIARGCGVQGKGVLL